MDEIVNSEVAQVFRDYPEQMRHKVMFLRKLILDTASETEGVGNLEEASQVERRRLRQFDQRAVIIEIVGLARMHQFRAQVEARVCLPVEGKTHLCVGALQQLGTLAILVTLDLAVLKRGGELRPETIRKV